jgi:hypothetical protein
MTMPSVASSLACACLIALPLGACVAGPANPSAARASELASLVSRAIACRAGNPRASTLDRFLAFERARGATPEHIASAQSTYITVSEAETINQDIRPRACAPEERADLRERMARVRAGRFDAL